MTRRRAAALALGIGYAGVTLALTPVAAGIDLLRLARGARGTLGLLAENTATETLDYFEMYAVQVLGATPEPQEDPS